MRNMKKSSTLGLLVLSFAFMGSAPAAPGPKFEKVYPLQPEEGVFAYSRISPDGRYLAYASETKPNGHTIRQVVTLVDLKTKKVLYTEPGIDAYFSTDNSRIIYSGQGGVSIYYVATGKTVRKVAPSGLGDYYSWATRENKDLILTITSNYYYLDGDKAAEPYARVQPCPSIGTGDRPLISKDGMKISTFVRGTVVVRNLTDCNYTFETGLNGAKSDFSWDGRYLAMHAPRPGSTMTRGGEASAYDIMVVDMKDRTVRNVTRNLKGSSYYPSYTRDGRLSFRYDGDDYHGFMFASDFLSLPAEPLPSTPQKVPPRRAWNDMFPETDRPAHAFNVVLVYGTWSAHSPIALADMQKARAYFEQNRLDIGVATATDPNSVESDVQKLLTSHEINLPRIPLAPERASLTEITNQSPSTLLFRDGELIDRKLGAQSFDELRQWVGSYGLKPKPY
jgi:hypothetical protein